MQTQVGDKFIYTNGDIKHEYYIVKQNKQGSVWLQSSYQLGLPLHTAPDWTPDTVARVMHREATWRYVPVNPHITLPVGV